MLLFVMGCPGTTGAIWRSDGTAEGTVPVIPLPANGWLRATSHTSTTLFFVVQTTEGHQLWKTDGTAEGTALLTTANYIHALSTAGNLAYFVDLTHKDPQGWAKNLWRSDGTAEGTFFLKKLNSERDVPNVAMASLGDTLLIISDSKFATRQLWRSDGTPESTVMLKEFALQSGVRFFLNEPFNGNILLIENFLIDQSIEFRLWQTDGTVAGTIPLDANLSKLASTYFYPNRLPSLGSHFFFPGFTEDRKNATLWSSDGTAQCTFQVAEFPQYSFLSTFSAGRSSILFVEYNEIVARLWVSDGTAYGTKQLAEFAAPYGNTGLASIHSITHVENDIYLVMRISQEQFNEPTKLSLWRSDGTTAGTTLLQEGFSLGPPDRFPSIPVVTKDALYFWVGQDAQFEEPQYTAQLWKLPRSAILPDPEVTQTPNPDIGTHTMMLPLIVDQC